MTHQQNQQQQCLYSHLMEIMGNFFLFDNGGENQTWIEFVHVKLINSTGILSDPELYQYSERKKNNFGSFQTSTPVPRFLIVIINEMNLFWWEK